VGCCWAVEGWGAGQRGRLTPARSSLSRRAGAWNRPASTGRWRTRSCGTKPGACACVRARGVCAECRDGPHVERGLSVLIVALLSRDSHVCTGAVGVRAVGVHAPCPTTVGTVLGPALLSTLRHNVTGARGLGSQESYLNTTQHGGLALHCQLRPELGRTYMMDREQAALSRVGVGLSRVSSRNGPVHGLLPQGLQCGPPCGLGGRRLCTCLCICRTRITDPLPDGALHWVHTYPTHRLAFAFDLGAHTGRV